MDDPTVKRRRLTQSVASGEACPYTSGSEPTPVAPATCEDWVGDKVIETTGGQSETRCEVKDAGWMPGPMCKWTCICPSAAAGRFFPPNETVVDAVTSQPDLNSKMIERLTMNIKKVSIVLTRQGKEFFLCEMNETTVSKTGSRSKRLWIPSTIFDQMNQHIRMCLLLVR